MGTSNITRVKIDGEVRVNQFCQWDGDPTSRGLQVLDFVRNLILEDRLEDMKEALRKVRLVNTSETDPELMHCTYTGAPLLEDGEKALTEVNIIKSMPKTRNYSDIIGMMLDSNILSAEMADYAMAAERGVGNDILPYLLQHRDREITLYTHNDINEEPDDIDVGIQSVFTIDMDNETVEIWWHGETDQFTFEELATCPTDEIDTRMDDLERTYYEELEEEFDDFLLPDQ